MHEAALLCARLGADRAASTPRAPLLHTPKGATWATGVCGCTSCFLSILHPSCFALGPGSLTPSNVPPWLFLLIGLGPWVALSEIIRLEGREVGCFLPLSPGSGTNPAAHNASNKGYNSQDHSSCQDPPSRLQLSSGNAIPPPAPSVLGVGKAPTVASVRVPQRPMSVFRTQPTPLQAAPS